MATALLRKLDLNMLSERVLIKGLRINAEISQSFSACGLTYDNLSRITVYRLRC
jgi:hypothetical protein